MGVKGQAAIKGDFVAFFPMAKEWGQNNFHKQTNGNLHSLDLSFSALFEILKFCQPTVKEGAFSPYGLNSYGLRNRFSPIATFR